MVGVKRSKKELHPKGKWTCPKCQVEHEYPHWKDHHQTDLVENKEFCKDGCCKESDESNEFEEDGYTPKPIYCPCCGFEENRVQLIKLKKGEVLEIA